MGPQHKSLTLKHFNFAIPLMAIAGLGAIGVFAVNQDIDETASASNVSPISSTISYDDEYITISNSAKINIGTADVMAAGDTYIYTTDNVTVSTNVSTGYDLYISSNNPESAALTNPDYYTEIAPTSGTGGDAGTPAVLDADSYGYAIPSSLATNSSFDADYSSPTSASKWAGVPAAGSSDRIHSTNTANTSGDTVDVHYGAYVTNYLAEGTYTGEVVYSAVVTPNFQTTNMKVSPSEGAEGTTLTVISGPTNISTSHELATSEVEVYFKQDNITKGACKVTKVDPSAGYLETTCTVPELGIGTYDVVVVVPRYGFTDMKSSGFSVTTMQSFTSSKCSALETFDAANSAKTTYSRVDSRDDNAYFIRKLADSHCWMVQNLRIMGKTLTTTDSDTSGSFTIPSTNSSWCTDNNTTCDDTIKVYYNNNTTYGAYYNWYTATAGSGAYSTTSGSVNYSICPKGWKLPLGNTASYSWYYLYNTGYSANMSNFQAATNTGSDYWAGSYTGSLNFAGSLSSWWSRTAYDTRSAYDLSSSNNNGGNINPQSYSLKWAGYPVRCVFNG